jgi:lysozyme
MSAKDNAAPAALAAAASLAAVSALALAPESGVELVADSSGERLPARSWTINAAGLQIIKQSEGLRLKAYPERRAWRIGYGHGGARPGQTITAAKAEALLNQDLHVCEGAVRSAVTVPVSRNEFSALVSLCYTLNERHFKGSAVVALLNDDKRDEAAQAFRQWIKPAGLATRRRREMQLFLS